MNRQILMMALVAGLAACGGAAEEQDVLDPEGGLEFSGKSDNGGLTDVEVQAVLEYVNQPLQDAAAFEAELDSELHRLAAEGIADVRVGADGQLNTADDGRFASLAELDAVRWVGVAAFRGLRRLAAAAGFPRGGVSCEEALDVNVVHITNLGGLRQLRDSGCDSVAGNLTVHISSRELLPTSDLDLHHLHALKSVDGQLSIELEKPGMQVRLPNLTFVKHLAVVLGRSNSLDLSNLRAVDQVSAGLGSEATLLLGSVQELERLSLSAGSRSTLDLGALQRVGSLSVSRFELGANANLRRVAAVDGLLIQSVQEVELPTLKEIAGNLRILSGPFDLSALQSVGGDVDFENGERDFSASDLPSLVFVGGTFRARGTGYGGSFANLLSVHKLDLRITCDSTAQGVDFASLEEVFDLDVHLRKRCDGMFGALREVDRNAIITFSNSVLGFEALERVNGLLRITDLSSSQDEMMPSLTWVRDLEVLHVRRIRGLNALETIERSLKLRSYRLQEIEGLRSLRAIGGNIWLDVPDVSQAEIEDLLARLPAFTGDVLHWN